MPNSIIKSFAKKSNESIQTVEKMWTDIKSSIDDKENYPLIVSILKKKLKIESTSFVEFLFLEKHKQ